MSNSSVDKLAVTPEDIAEIQADIPEMAQELGWSKQEPWMHELGKRITTWDAAKIGKYSLRVELMRRLDPDYYTRSGHFTHIIRRVSDNKPWQPSPISVLRSSKRIQINLDWRNKYTVWAYADSIEIRGSRNSYVNSMGIQLRNYGYAKSRAGAVRFVSEITGLSFKEIKGAMKYRKPNPESFSEYFYCPLPEFYFTANPQLLRPQN